MSADEDDGWNPLLHLDECVPTFRDAALELKANGRVPHPREHAQAVQELAKLQERAKLASRAKSPPEQWTRRALATDLPSRKGGGRPANAHHVDVGELTTRLLPYFDSEREARAEAQKRLSRPWDPAVVRELVTLVRGIAHDEGQAQRWVGAFLASPPLTERRVRELCAAPAAVREWLDADGRRIDPDVIFLDDIE